MTLSEVFYLFWDRLPMGSKGEKVVRVPKVKVTQDISCGFHSPYGATGAYNGFDDDPVEMSIDSFSWYCDHPHLQEDEYVLVDSFRFSENEYEDGLYINICVGYEIRRSDGRRRAIIWRDILGCGLTSGDMLSLLRIARDGLASRKRPVVIDLPDEIEDM